MYLYAHRLEQLYGCDECADITSWTKRLVVLLLVAVMVVVMMMVMVVVMVVVVVMFTSFIPGTYLLFVVDIFCKFHAQDTFFAFILYTNFTHPAIGFLQITIKQFALTFFHLISIAVSTLHQQAARVRVKSRELLQALAQAHRLPAMHVPSGRISKSELATFLVGSIARRDVCAGGFPPHAVYNATGQPQRLTCSELCRPQPHAPLTLIRVVQHKHLRHIPRYDYSAPPPWLWMDIRFPPRMPWRSRNYCGEVVVP